VARVNAIVLEYAGIDGYKTLLMQIGGILAAIAASAVDGRRRQQLLMGDQKQRNE
jgi:hypothetical protein